MLRPLLRDLQLWQWRIEDIANQPGDCPPRLIHDHEVRPIQTKIENGVTSLMSLEQMSLVDKDADSMMRKLADFRYAFTNATASLERVVLDPKESNREDFINAHRDALSTFDALNRASDRMSQEQRATFKWI